MSRWSTYEASSVEEAREKCDELVDLVVSGDLRVGVMYDLDPEIYEKED